MDSVPRTLTDFIDWTARRFTAAGIYFGHGTDNALDEAAWLVASALQLAPHELDEHLRDQPTEPQSALIQTLAEKRITTRQPLAYLLKEAWFAGLKFYVDERVIVPRSLTAEFIMEQFQPWIEPAPVRRILDLGTGSGCMAIACAYAFPTARVDAADIAEDALAVAQINLDIHAMHERVRLIRSDLFTALAGERYDIIVTNPPYVDVTERETLPPEYRHEPALALYSRSQGLEMVTRLLTEAGDHLNARGILITEVGNSTERLQQKFSRVPFTWLTTSKGDESVFLLTAAQIRKHADEFVNA